MTPTAPTGSSSTLWPAKWVRLVISINGIEYLARPLAAAELPTGATRGFRLSRDDPKSGRVACSIARRLGGLWCSCPDDQFCRSHGGICNHLSAAVAVGLL